MSHPSHREVQKSFQDGQIRGRKAIEGYQIIINQKGYLHLSKSQSHKELEVEITLWGNIKYFCVLALFLQPSPGRALGSGDALSSQPGLS